MPDTDHEREICDIVAHEHVKGIGAILENRRYPELEHPVPANPVDAVYYTDLLTIVMEHTTIESYPHQQTEDKKIAKISDSIGKELESRISAPGHYEVAFSIGQTWDKKMTKDLLSSIADWVVTAAPQLQPGSHKTAPAHVVTKSFAPTGYGQSLNVSLYRWPGAEVRVRFPRLIVTNELQSKLEAKMAVSLERKLPKLFDWKSAENAESILVLESVDVGLGSRSSLVLALLKTVRSRDNAPNFVYLAETFEDTCTLWRLAFPYNGHDSTSAGQYPLRHPLHENDQP